VLLLFAGFSWSFFTKASLFFDKGMLLCSPAFTNHLVLLFGARLAFFQPTMRLAFLSSPSALLPSRFLQGSPPHSALVFSYLLEKNFSIFLRFSRKVTRRALVSPLLLFLFFHLFSHELSTAPLPSMKVVPPQAPFFLGVSPGGAELGVFCHFF